MKLKPLVLMIGLMLALAANQAAAEVILFKAHQAERNGAGAEDSNSKDKTTPPKPDATMSSPVPPVSGTANPQAPNGATNPTAIPKSAVGIPPPPIRVEIPGQPGQSSIPQPAVGLYPPAIRSLDPHQVPPMPKVEHQIQRGTPAANVGPGPQNPNVGR
ncbi:hypothetical protein [Polynucleobacter sp. es-EL-1]|uniref:hypothetical protein n=1 Tax=Polynucleobacter sp. es-EL-1 TaxID=1855652 RepID=UPI001BFE44ED|nr:hypothetical protein [Polynucleobacter sp. es-EL-1]QWE09791.1 hypothetical protein FD974_05370 [Polynucleobacter sp. es-EL-1]